MKIAIIGSGAMGCLYGSYLNDRHEVYFIDAYAPQIESLKNHGLKIIENTLGMSTQEKHILVNAYPSGAFHKTMDLLIIFVKANHTFRAIEENQGLFDHKTMVLTLQNGAGNDRDLMHFIKPENIVIGTSKHNSVTIAPGLINHTASGITSIGGASPSRVEEVRRILDESGIETEISDDIQRIIWSKLFVNISINTLTALLQTPIGFMASNDYAWDFAKKIIYEAINVAEEDGTYFDRREVLSMVKSVCEKAGNGYASMYQDRQKGLLTEIDKLNGAIVEQAKLYGIATPYNSLVVDLIHAVEGTYTLNIS
jgi:2-dehydropantoate 2-reductase